MSRWVPGFEGDYPWSAGRRCVLCISSPWSFTVVCTSSAWESSAGASMIPLQITSRGRRPMVRRQVCCQRSRNEGLGMPDLENHRFAARLAYFGRSLSKDTVWMQKVSDTFLRLKSDPKAEGRRKQRGRKALRNLPGSSDLSRPWKELYLDLVVDPASNPLVEGLGWSMVEGVRFGLLEQRVLAYLVACTERVAPFRLEWQS